MDLGPEPPAVAGLLVNSGSTNAGAAGSTLLDLAAAGYVELRQPEADPYGTTIHLAGEHPDEGGLRPYERQVLARVRELAVDGVVPLTALAFRDDNESKTWNSRLHAAVVADARAAGLSQRRFGRSMMTALYLGALAVGVVCGLVAVHRTHLRWTFLVSLTVAAVLAGLVQHIGERATPAGSEATARWLGVRAWLRNHEQFAELPPSAVAIWDRYLAYGAALGVTRHASDVLDLGAGVRRNLWSSYRGGYRRIRVHDPRPPAGPDSELTGPSVTDVFGEVRDVRAGPLPVSVEDVARLVGQPVRVERRPQRVDFRSELDDTTVLRAAWAGGTAGQIAWRANARGVATPLPGIGDEAYASGNRVVMRVGDITLVLTALGGGRMGVPHLPWLLTRCERDALTRT